MHIHFLQREVVALSSSCRDARIDFRRESDSLQNFLVHRLMHFERAHQSRTQTQREEHHSRLQALRHEHNACQRLWKTEVADAQLVLREAVEGRETLQLRHGDEVDRMTRAVRKLQEQENSFRNEIREQSQQLQLSREQLSAAERVAESLEEQVGETRSDLKPFTTAVLPPFP